MRSANIRYIRQTSINATVYWQRCDGMTSGMTKRKEEGVFRLVIRETFATTIWTITILSTLLIFPSQRAFLTMLAGLMTTWEALGLSLGSVFNPAVTMTLVIARKETAARGLIMASCQFIGHIIARAMLEMAVPNAKLLGPRVRMDVGDWVATALEAILTAVVALIAVSLEEICGHEENVRKLIVMTMTVLSVIVSGSEVTGACLNPAMAFSMAIFDGNWNGHAVYWLGPFVGGVMSGYVYQTIFGRKKLK